MTLHQLFLLAAVLRAMQDGETPQLTEAEWCEAERLFEEWEAKHGLHEA
jgi:hypothetical protein